MSANRVILDGSTIRILALSSVTGVTTFLALTDTPTTYAGQTLKVLRVNAGGTALEFSDAGAGDALVANPLSQFAATTSAQLRGVISDETGSGLLYFQGGDIGTPSAGVATNLTGTAAGLTAGTVTTNANLTGPVTSTGNATAIANGAITNAMLANGAVANLSGTNTGDQTSIVGITGTLAEFNTALSDADFATGGGTVTGASSGTNTGDQTSIVGITGTLAEFNTALSDADFATGGGTVTGASSGTNTGDQTSIVGITGTLAEFNTALSDADFATGGGTVTGASSGTNTGDQTSIVGITGTLAEFNTALSDADFATGGGTVTGASSGTNTGDQTSIVGITGTLAEFNTALSDADFATGGGTVTGASSGTNTGDQTSIVGITGTLAEFNTALSDADFATGGGTVTGASSGTNTGDQTSIVGITGTLAEFNTALSDADFATGGGTVTGASSGTNTGDQTSVTGNSGSTDALKSATTTINVSSATAPTVGQVLTATSDSAATWQTVAGTGDALVANPLSQFAATTSAQLRGVISDESGTGVLYFQGGDIGTPSAGVATNLTGTASGLTAGNVTTNADLTGPVTSTGNATAIANGAITNAMLANGAVANLSGTNTGDQTSVSGNSGSTDALKSATTTINVSSATAPTVGQVLTATSDSAATWQNVAVTGDVVGPASATDNAIVRYDSTTGKLVQNSAVFIDDSGFLGVGVAAPTNIIDVRLDQNTHTSVQVLNETVDTAAMARFIAHTGVFSISMEKYSTSYTSVGPRRADFGGLFTAGAGLNLAAAGASSVFGIYTGGSADANLRVFISAAGAVGFGTAQGSTPVSLVEIQGGLTTVGAVFTLGTKETSVVASDVLGRVDFYAPLDAAGGDANLLAASIVAVAEGTFSATSNATTLEFRTGASEVATTKMTLTSAGDLDVTGTMTATNLSGTNTGDQTSVTGNSGSTDALKSATTTINVSSATAPTVGQVLTATSSTAATWQNAGTGDALVANPLSQFAATTSAQLRGVLSDETGTGLAYFQDGDIGTPSAGVATNLTGTASGLTAGTVTTNANLTGEVTSTGNAAVIDKTAITGKTLVTADGADHVLIADASDSDNLKKVLVSDFGGGGGALTYNQPASDHTSGTIAELDTVTVGESVVFGDTLYLKSDGKWWKSDADAASTMPGLRMALETKSADQTCSTLVKGYARDDTWAWTVGGLIYFSTTAGTLTQVAPSGTGDQVQIAGIASTADIMFFDPSPVLGEIT